MASDAAAPLLEVSDLHVQFKTRDGIVRAVNGMSFTLHEGETIAILGESGSGKSVTAQAIMGILDPKIASIPQGSITYRGQELVGLSERENRKLRGADLALIFQDALSALNPVTCVGDQVAEMFRVHGGASRKEAKAQAIEVMGHVGIPAADKRFGDYPHQFSGGMRQRIMIAMMIAMRPAVLIADEPTTALDVTVQAQIMELLQELQEETGTGLVLITHDLGVVASVAERIVVMYSGRVMEQGLRRRHLRDPRQSVHGRPARVDPPARREDRPAPRHPRAPAEPAGRATRVPVPPALPACGGAVLR